MYNEDNFAVKIECGRSVGSGVLCQYSERAFLITAAHCVTGLDENIIKLSKQINGKISEIPFQLKKYVVDERDDIAIFEVKYIEEYPALKTENINQDYIVCGFPHIYERESSKYKRQRLNGMFLDVPEQGFLQLSLREEIETGQSTASDTVGGLSGACIYSDVNGVIFINGILIKLSSKEGAFGAVIGVGASKIIEIIEANFELAHEEKIYTDITVEDIDVSIVPTITGEDICYTYDEFADYVQNERKIIQIIGAGGSGKTSFMKCLMKSLELKKKLIVYLQLSILEKDLEEVIESCSSEAYVFLDGFNEVEYMKQEQIVETVRKSSAINKSQTFIISSRKKITGELGYLNTETFYVNPLDGEVIDAYVSKYQMELPVPKKLKSLLTNPMMLTVYTKRCSEKLKNEEVIYFKFYNSYSGQAELISDYLESLIVKIYMDNNRNRKSLTTGLLVRYFLFPEIAYFMEKNNVMYIEQEMLLALLSTWIKDMENKSKYLMKWFLKRELEFSFEEQCITELKIIRYLKSEQSIFNPIGLKWGFAHQNYRDELAAEKIILDMQYDSAHVPNTFKNLISFDVISYMSELLKNDRKLMMDILDRMRYKVSEKIGDALHNWLEIQKRINENLAGMDFSHLDLKNQILAPHINGKNGLIHTCFKGAHIYRENFFPIGHSSRVTEVCFMHSGEYYATAADNGMVLVCDTRSGKVVKRLETGRSDFSTDLVFSSDDKFIFLALSLDVVGWSIETGAVVFFYHSEHGIVRDISLSPCGRFIAIATEWYEVKVVQYLNNEEELSVVAYDIYDDFRKVAYSKDGRSLLVAYASGKVELWEIRNKKILFSKRYEKNGIRDVKYSNDGKKIAVAYESGRIYIMNAESGEESVICDYHKNFCFMVNFSPDDRRLVSASSDNTVIIWEVDTGKPFNILHNHKEFVQVAKYDTIGEVIISSDCDGVINVWEANTGELRFSLSEHQDIVGALAIHPYEKIFVSGSLDEKAILWNYETGEKIQVLQNLAKRIGEYCMEKEYILTVDEPSQVARVWNYQNVCLWEKKTAYDFLFGNRQSYYMWDKNVLSKFLWTNEQMIWEISFEDGIRSVILSPLKNFVCVVLDDLRIHLLKASNGTVLWSDMMSKYGVEFSPYEKHLIYYSGGNQVKIYEIFQQETIETGGLSYENGNRLMFSQDEEILYVDRFRAGIDVIDLANLKKGTVVHWPFNRCFMSDNNMLIAAVSEKNELFVADGMQFNKILSLPEGNIRYVDVNHNHTLIVVVYTNNFVIIIDILERVIKEELRLSDNVWRITFLNNNSIVYIDDTKLIEYDFHTKKKKVILNQSYDAKLVGCDFEGAIFDENIGAEEKELLINL